MTFDKLRALTPEQRRALWLENNPPKPEKKVEKIDKQQLKGMLLPLELTPEQAELVHEFNVAVYKLAGTIVLNVPMCPEVTIACRKLQEAEHYFGLAARRKLTPIDKVEQARAKQNPLAENQLSEADGWEGPKE